MFNRKLTIGSLLALSVVTLCGAAASTIAWLTQSSFLNFGELNGASEGAYFAYGKGTTGEPYGIRSARHLYNLAWLNMRGYFEGKDRDGDGKNDTFYFEIDPNLSGDVLSGLNDLHEPMVIPPIGTIEHPFYGSFNGNGKIISDFVISAEKTDYNQKPYNVDEFFITPEIVGLFGVVGEIDEESEYTYNTSANQIYNLGLTNLEIRTAAQHSLVGIVAGYVNGSITNVAVNASSIDVDTATTAPTTYSDYISEYGIIGHCTKNYSEVVDPLTDYYDKKDAYNTTAQIYAVNTLTRDAFNAREAGEAIGSGASIDMKAMYTKLHANWQVLIGNPSTYKTKYFTGTKEITIKDGITTVDSMSNSYANTYNNFNKAETQSYSGQASGYHSYYSYTQSDNSHQTASYNYIIEPYSPYSQIGSSGLTEEDYMCLGGAKERTIPRYATNSYVTHTLVTNNWTDYDGHYISYTSGSVTNYLTRGATNLNLTTPTDASLWYFDADNGVFCTTIRNNESNFYYLNCDSSGNLSVTTTSNTTWSYNNTLRAYCATVSGNTFCLGFDGTKWTTTIYHSTTETYYLIHNGNNYITHGDNNNSNPGNTNSTTKPTDSSAKWYLSGSNFVTTSGGNISLRIRKGNGNNYYPYVSSYNGTSVAPTTALDFSNTNTNTRILSAYVNNSTRYLYFNNSWTASNSSQNLTIDKVSVTQGYENEIHCQDIAYTDANQIFYKKTTTTSNTERSTLNTISTYFPLKSTLTNNNLSVDDTNTGYVVSGSYFTTDPYGDIRVSSFNISDLSGSYSQGSSSFSSLYTYDGSTHNVLADGSVQGTNKVFEQFVNSNSQMISTLKDNNTSNKIYGLHFMDASISKDHTIRVPWVKFADKDPQTIGDGEEPYSTYADYQLPEDSIDFHFKENGIINFFAGTYYEDSTVGANNTFFSLHQIFRYTSGENANDIKDIAEIQYVYENTDASTKAATPYVYRYKKQVDGSYYSSVGTPGDTILFNTDWITNPTIEHTDSAYYFEIPANKGEYALGSVKDKAGSYLMYLDLGANANKIARTQVSEHITTTEEIYDYPLGVSFTSSFTRTGTIIDSDPKNSANIMIEAGYSGSIDFERVGNTITAAIGNGSKKSNILGGYRKDTVSLTDGSDEIEGVPKEKITKDIKRIQLLDYGINYLTLTRTVVEEIVETHEYFGVIDNDDTVTTRTMKQYVYNADGSLNESKTITDPSKESSITVYNPDDLNKPGQPYSDPKNQVFALLNANESTVICTFTFPSYEGTEVTLSFELIKSSLDQNYHYSIDGYDIVVVVTGETITITIVDSDSHYTFTINGVEPSNESATVSQS